MPAKRGATIRIYLVDGTPQGVRVVERPGWTGACMAFARSDYAEARTRTEAATCGVYVLVGPDPQGGKSQRAYVGEADNVRIRLDKHQKTKDFWTQGCILTTKDRSLNKAHIRYLEARLIALAHSADTASVENGTVPPLPELSEPEVADMESYLENVLILLPLIGVDIFERADVLSPTTAFPASSRRTRRMGGHDPILYLRTPLTDAIGEDTARGFLVHAGTLARCKPARSMTSYYQRLRDRLVEGGVLVDAGDDQLRLTKAYLFESPSAAASVLSGGSKNGRIEWKDGHGRALRELQEQSTL